MQLKYLRCFVLFCLLCFNTTGYTQNTSEIGKKLAELKSKNDLTEWLYERIEYASTNQQLSFLLNTQKEVWRQPANTDEHIAWLTLLSTQGFDLLQAGNILSSINYYEDAYAYFYKYKVIQFDIVEYVFKPLSNNYTRLGDLERAVFIQQKTIDRLNAFEYANEIASVYSNMAIAYYTMGNYALAASCVDKGVKLAKSSDVNLRLQNIMADVLYDQNQLSKARALLLKNILSPKKLTGATASGQLGAYTTLGNINLKAGMLNDAEKNFAIALTIIDTWFKGDKVREKAKIITGLGKIERFKNHPEKALLLFNNALQILKVNTLQNITQQQNIYAENTLVDIFHEKALANRALKQHVTALQNMRYALLANDKIRREFADNKTKERLQKDGKTLAETAIKIAVELYNKSNDKKYLTTVLEIAEQTKARTLADQIQLSKQQLITNTKDATLKKQLDIERAIAYNQRMVITEKNPAKYQQNVDALKYDLSLINKESRKRSADSVLSASAMLTSLPANLHVIEFFFGVQSVYLIDIKNHAVNNVIQIGNADSLGKQVSAFVNTYYRNGPNAMLNSPKQFFTASNILYNTLLKNVPLQANQKLCIIADDVLGYLSFDGFITDNKYNPAMSQWPFLIKKLNTTYAFSINSLIKNKAKSVDGTTFNGLFVTHDGKNSTPILAVKKEADAIQKLVKGNYLYNDEVNNKSFYNSFENSAILHVSTHAYLSGINMEPTLDFGNEKLFLFELLAKKNKPNLVVLSACRTNDGLMAKGEGIISLSRGFSAIGTPATIAGLWNVNDEAVANITENIYKFLLNGNSSGTALHLSKLNWLNTPKVSEAMYLPYYWDSLILMGTDEQVNLQAVNNRLYLYYIAAVILALFTGFKLFKKIKQT